MPIFFHILLLAEEETDTPSEIKKKKRNYAFQKSESIGKRITFTFLKTVSKSV